MENSRKFLVYTSDAPHTNRLRVVGAAVSKIANSLKLDTEFSPKRKLLSIYVYYRSEAGDEIPIYCDWGKSWGEEDVCRAIRSMMFVLSFHPNHSSLRSARKEMCISA
ncbi:hypothetical protein KAS06_03815 [Candidatus Bathyarchaeota archaeon]|nr:hypothetical protein [Candidatus Bathyarchaeota archaeon]